jgi:hypothetical protein
VPSCCRSGVVAGEGVSARACSIGVAGTLMVLVDLAAVHD